MKSTRGKNNGSGRLIFYAALLVLNSIFPSCTQEPYKEINLSENWKFRQANGSEWLSAIVPGTVHGDLLHHGLIPDPFIGMNDTLVQWVEEKDWEYRTRFKVPRSIREMDAVRLQFDGLDTYADVFLNGHKILEASNMFLGYEVDVKNYLTGGRNELVIYFHSPVRKGLEKLQQLPYLLQATSEQAPEAERTSIFTRKAPFQYGWDWGPRLVTSGVWRPVTLKGWNNARLIDPYLATDSIVNHDAFVSMDVALEALAEGDYTLITKMNGIEKALLNLEGLKPGLHSLVQDLRIEEPALWWPNSLGAPKLQKVEFALKMDGKVIDTYRLDFGIRTIKLVQQPDDVGASFHFEVNGTPVFMKGANVVPPDPLLTRNIEKSYHRIIQDALAANMNMLRVWGGGIYKDEEFYRLCDQNGILVWQDFMFACALQPGDEAHLENIRREAEYQVKRLRNHASLALWCGNNENLTAWYRWGWRDLYTTTQAEFIWRTYQKIFYEILPQAISANHPKAHYHASSPSSINNTVSDRRSGNEHDWTVWFALAPIEAYARNLPRFVSEFGMQSLPEMETLRYFAGEGPHDLFSPMLQHRQRSRIDWFRPGYTGNNFIQYYTARYFPEPRSFEELSYSSRLVQAKAYKTAIEAHRRNMPHCMGSLYWQINDTWPAISWSTVDYFGNWKPSHYAVRNANEAVIASPVSEKDRLKVYVVSDLLQEVSARLHIKLIDVHGTKLMDSVVEFRIQPNRSGVIFEIPNINRIVPGSTKWMVATSLTGNAIHHENALFSFRASETELSPHPVNYHVFEKNGAYFVELWSEGLIKGLFVECATNGNRFSENYFSLLPGIRKTIKSEAGKVGDLTFASLNSIRAGLQQEAIQHD